MKAVFLDWASLGPDLDAGALHALLPDLTIHAVTADDEVSERIEGAQVVFGNKARITADIIAATPSLRYIGLTATGTDNVDLDAARAAGITVSNIRAYCTASVAEHVFGCLLELTHKLSRYNASVRAGAWQSSSDFCLLTHPIRELAAMTLGVVGYGELGRGVARIGEAFGMRVIVSARPGSDTVPDGRVPFETVLDEADAISLHCPLNETTRGLIDRDALARMRPDAILVNTARGGLVDSAALADALRNGAIGAAAIDVLPQEPPVDGDPLLEYLATGAANLVVTPHIAWGSHEARQAAVDQLTANCAAFLQGKPQNAVV